MVERLVVPPSVDASAREHGWTMEARAGRAGALHMEPVAPARTVRVNLVSTTALVLGSSQGMPAGSVPDGVEVAVRRSGGGAVWLEPAAQVWVDVVVPRDDPQFTEDVGLSFHWLGSAWARCVGRGAQISVEGMQHREAGALACFAGIGPGEVLLGESKVVGISQRRTRELARFQSVAYFQWRPAKLIAALDCPEPVRRRLETAVSPLPAGGDLWVVVERLVAALP